LGFSSGAIFRGYLQGLSSGAIFRLQELSSGFRSYLQASGAIFLSGGSPGHQEISSKLFRSS